MPRLTRSVTIPLALLVVTPLLLVHATISGFAAGRQKKPPAGTAAQTSSISALPLPVVEMREAILSAARSGDIEELRVPMQWNELPPEIDAPVAGEAVPQAPAAAAPAASDAGKTDPIAQLRRASSDGLGHEVLGALAAILEAEPAVVPHGRDVENSKLYVWPGFAIRPLSAASADDRALVERVAPADTEPSLKAGKYLGWRIVIGADGTWHSLGRGPRP